MKPLSREDIAYAAGFFDGEGCVSIQQRPARCKSPDYTLNVRVGNTNLAVLEWFRERFGGAIYSQLTTGNRKPSWHWHLGNRKAVDFLLIVKPFIQVKLPQVVLAEAYVSLNGKRDPSVRAVFRGRMNELNHRGVREQNGERTASVTIPLTH